MRLVFIDSYYIAVLAVSICTGMTLLQRVLSICWILAFISYSVYALWSGVWVHTLMRTVLYCQIPAILLVLAAPLTPSFHIEGWTDGILAIWETPFEPLLELLPPFHIGHLSGMYLEDCAAPFLILALVVLLAWGVRIAKTEV